MKIKRKEFELATLSPEQKKKARKRRLYLLLITTIVSFFIFPYLAYYIAELFTHRLIPSEVEIKYIDSYFTLKSNPRQLQLLFLIYCAYALFMFWLLTFNSHKITRTDTITVAGDIKIPIAVGEGQYGTARFLKEKEIKTVYSLVTYNGKDIDKDSKRKNLGLVIGMTKVGDKEMIICIIEDKHTIIIGATRSGKTRREIAETIWLRSFCEKSMIINDPKGDLYLFFYPYLIESGYDVYTFDLNSPRKSMHYNFLHYICQAAVQGDIPQAIDYTWDLVSVLVGEPKGEPLWTNGTAASIAAAILTLVMQAAEVYQNLTNCYEFIHHMCKDNGYDEMPIVQYFADLPDTHPAKMVFAAAEISPDKMRGSFFGSALTVLRLFTDWNIAEMTSKSDFDLKDIGKKKSALFIIIPDEKTSRYSLASLFISQAYVALTEVARKNGNRLPVPVDFILDEFGNCPAIPGFGTMMSVGAGRGIRFTLVLQDYQQLEKLYKHDHENIKGNSQVTVYLKTPTQKTLDELSKRTGTYTVQANSSSSQGSSKSSSNSVTSSANMVSRSLLFPDEIGRIDYPYSLVYHTGKYPAIMYSPDLSEYYANKELGLGDEEYNKKIIMEREEAREERDITPPLLWGIWNQEKEKKEETKTYSFLDSE